MSEQNWRPARLIPVAGRKQAEPEVRVTSVLLAGLSAVDEFWKAILRPLGAPAGKISTFREVSFWPKAEQSQRGGRKQIDGVIRVRRGKRTWTLLVEVKTRGNSHTTKQIEDYLDIVKGEKFDGLLTISNQLAVVPGQHPVKVDGRRYRDVPLYHLSWARILSTALRVKEHIGVEDPDQAWILDELLEYLQQKETGAQWFDDMGPSWSRVRRTLPQGTVEPKHTDTETAVEQWGRLLQHISLRLAADVGGDVHPVVSERERRNPEVRTRALIKELVRHGTLSGAIRVPEAISPVTIEVELREPRVAISASIASPDFKRPTTRLKWLLRRLEEAPDSLLVTLAAGGRSSGRRSLQKVRSDPKAILDELEQSPTTFTITQSRKVSATRKLEGRRNFIHDTNKALSDFYSEVVQHLKPWVPPAAKLPDEPVDDANAP